MPVSSWMEKSIGRTSCFSSWPSKRKASRVPRVIHFLACSSHLSRSSHCSTSLPRSGQWLMSPIATPPLIKLRKNWSHPQERTPACPAQHVGPPQEGSFPSRPRAKHAPSKRRQRTSNRSHSHHEKLITSEYFILCKDSWIRSEVLAHPQTS